MNYLKNTSLNLTKSNPKNVEDNFDRYPNSTSLNGLGEWVVNDGVLQTYTDGSIRANINAESSEAHFKGAFHEDQYAEIKLNSFYEGADWHGMGVTLRNFGDGDYYYAVYDNYGGGTGTVYIGSRSGVDGTEKPIVGNLQVNDVLRLEARGIDENIRLTVKINGKIISGDMTPPANYYINSGNPGLWAFDNNADARADDWKAGELISKSQPEEKQLLEDFEEYQGNFGLHTRERWFNTTGGSTIWTWLNSENVAIYGGGGGIVSYTGQAFSANHAAELKVFSVSDYWHEVGVSTRGQISGPNSGDGYFLGWNPSDSNKNLSLGFYKGGQETYIQQQTFDFVSGDKYKLRVSGEGVNTRLTADINTGQDWESVFIDIDPTGLYLDGGAPGIKGSAGTTASRWDNFYAYDLPHTTNFSQLEPINNPLDHTTGFLAAYSFAHNPNNKESQNFSDNFNRAGGDLGSNWTQLDATVAPEDESAHIEGSSVFGINVYNESVYKNQFSQIEIGTGLGGFNTVEVSVRGNADLSNFYAYAAWARSTGITIYKNNGGGDINLGHHTIDCLVGDTLRIEAIGDEISAFHNGTKVVSVTDGTALTGGVGFNLYADPSTSGVYADNWNGGSLNYLMRVRREIDGLEKNIGADANGNLNADSLLKHVGTGNGFVSALFDQGLSGANLYQSTLASQPQIVRSGIIERDSAGIISAYFDGSDDFLGEQQLPIPDYPISLVAFCDVNSLDNSDCDVITIADNGVNDSYHSLGIRTDGYAAGVSRESSFVENATDRIVSGMGRIMIASTHEQLVRDIYLNDKIDGSEYTSITYPGITTEDIAIGCLDRLSRTNYYKGHISDAYIFDTKLTQGSITNLHNQWINKYAYEETFDSFAYISGSTIAIPDSELNSVVGNIDIRLKIAAEDYSPDAGVDLCRKYGAAGNRAWYLYLLAGATQRMRFMISEDGSNIETPFVTLPPSINGQEYWFRVLADFDNSVIQFYSCSDYNPISEYGNWTQISTDRAITYTGLFNSSEDISIGSGPSGRMYYTEIRDGIDGPIVAKFNASEYNISGIPNVVGEADWTQSNVVYSNNKVLDAVPGAEAAFSLVEISSGYQGPLVRARNELGDVQDFYQGRYAGHLNTVRGGDGTDITDFAADSHAYVETWYDQSNHYNHAFQSGDLNSQPYIVISGNLVKDNRGLPVIHFLTESSMTLSGNTIESFNGATSMAATIWYYEDSNVRINGNDYWTELYSQMGAAGGGPGNTAGWSMLKHGDSNGAFVGVRNSKDNEFVSNEFGDELPSGQWNLFNFSYDGGQATDLDELKVYIAGTQISVQVPDWGSQPWVPDSMGTVDQPFEVGINLTGSIGDAILWTRSLEQDEQNILWGHYNR